MYIYMHIYAYTKMRNRVLFSLANVSQRLSHLKEAAAFKPRPQLHLSHLRSRLYGQHLGLAPAKLGLLAITCLNRITYHIHLSTRLKYISYIVSYDIL